MSCYTHLVSSKQLKFEKLNVGIIIMSYIVIKENKGAGEIAQSITVVAAPPEDPGLSHSNHRAKLSLTPKTLPSDSTPSLSPHKQNTHIHKINNF